MTISLGMLSKFSCLGNEVIKGQYLAYKIHAIFELDLEPITL
jgi:hypothetical protein